MRRLLLFIIVLPQIASAGYEDGAPDGLPRVGQPPSQVSPVQIPGPPAAKPPAYKPQPVRPPVGSPAPPTQTPNGYPTAFQPPAPTRPTPLQSPPPTRLPVGTPPSRPPVRTLPTRPPIETLPTRLPIGTATTPVGGPASPIQSPIGRNTTYQPTAPTRPTPRQSPPPVSPPPTRPLVRPPPTQPPAGTPPIRPPVRTLPTRPPIETLPTRPPVITGTTPIGSPASPTQSPNGRNTTYQPPTPTRPTPLQSPPPTQPPIETGTMPDGIGQAPPSNPAFEACIQTNPREQDAVLLSPVGFAASSPFASSLQASDIFSEPTERNQCLSIQCICQFARGRYSNNRCVLPDGQVYGKAYRKEFRMMTDDERNRFRNAMWGIRTTQYLTLSRLHSSYVTSPAAHSGPAFLPWHREFIKRFLVIIFVSLF
ncbi:unnamed protein product [Haemonchus placei]|uniref:Tyrosinase_Cu-bd domain-containing protein n=1 Tax=Haemonchus placei TaxID=6290 RepID=A0A0N4VVU5_HAEPC|nr:unnamed protein product [Haemonchus placei]